MLFYFIGAAVRSIFIKIRNILFIVPEARNFKLKYSCRPLQIQIYCMGYFFCPSEMF
jgi:hypothetical protein